MIKVETPVHQKPQEYNLYADIFILLVKQPILPFIFHWNQRPAFQNMSLHAIYNFYKGLNTEWDSDYLHLWKRLNGNYSFKTIVRF